jgi:hypothetical protein
MWNSGSQPSGIWQFWTACALLRMTLPVMLLPDPQVSVAAEDNPDAPDAETDAQLAAVALKLRIVLADALQLKGTGHVLLVYAFDHCPHARVENPM